jgi:ribosome maturation factor RimP
MDLKKVNGLLEPVLGPLGYELVDARFLTEHGRHILRLFVDRVDREGGMTVGDCERVSREVETLLEVEGILGERSVLEVSSPGLNRPLTKEADFTRFAGKAAEIATTQPIEAHGGRRNYKGTLRGVENGEVVVEVDQKDYRVPLALIERAHLVY